MSSFVDRSHPSLVGGGLIPDEHRYREAAVRHKRLDLMNRRLDARISSLESLATQGTLVAGFGYTTLTRSQDDIGEASRFSEAFVALFAALSVGAAIWVVYLSGYAAIRARIAFLMGSDRRAAEDAIQVLRETHERARDCFDLSLSALVLCASSRPRSDAPAATPSVPPFPTHFQPSHPLPTRGPGEGQHPAHHVRYGVL